jgi:hypothetical protein
VVDDLSVSFNVFNGFFESVGLSLEGSQDVRLGGVLGSLEFFLGDGGQSLQFGGGNFEELVSVAGGTGDAETEETSIGEVEVKSVDGINETVFIEDVGGASVVKSAVTSPGVGGTEEGANDL